MKVKKASLVMKAVREFTDREEPRASFWKAYHKVKVQLASEEPDITVLTYYGIGGIGKSTLLRKLIAELEEQETAPCYVRYDLNDQQECRVVLERIKNVLSEKYKFQFPLFELGSFVYAKKMGEKVDRQEVEQIAEKSPVLSMLLQVTETIPVVGIAAKVLSLADQSVAHIRTHLQNHRPELMQIEGLEPEELYAHLPYLFAQDMTANLEKHNKQPLVVFLDTYEKLVNELSQTGEPLKFDEWLRGEDGVVQNIPHVLWVIAGREKLKWERFDADWSEALEQHILGNLSFSDSDSFLRKAGVESEELRSQLYNLTHGTPVYLDLCVDQYCRFVDKGITPARDMFGDNTYDLIERFVRYMSDTQKDMVYMLACLQSWDDDMIEQLGSRIVPGFSLTVYERTKEYSFVLPKDDGSYSIHQTVGEILRDACPHILRKRAGTALRERYTTVFEKRRMLSEEYATALMYTARAALLEHDEDEALCAYVDEHIRTPLLAFIKAGRFQQAAALLDLLLSRAKEESHLRACILALISHMNRLAGEFEKALTIGRSAEALCLALLGENHPDTLVATKYIAEALYKLGHYDQTCEYHERLLEKCRAVLGEDHPHTLNVINGLAVSYDALGKNEESLRLQRIAYEKRRAVLGEKHPDTLLSLLNTALALRNLGEYDTAREMQETVLATRREMLGEDHPDTLRTIGSLASTYGMMGDYERARVLKEQVLEKSREMLGENHPDTLSAMSSLASTLDDLKRYTEARELYETVLRKCRETFGEHHPRTLGVMNDLAVVLSNMGEYAAAADLHTTVLVERRKALGDDHPKTISAMNNLANVQFKMRDYALAVMLYRSVEQAYRVSLGENHPKTLTALRNLGDSQLKAKQLECAQKTFEELLEKQCTVFGEQHAKVASTRVNLGEVYTKRELYAQAAVQYEQALAYCRADLEEDSSVTTAVMNALATALYYVGETEKAYLLYEEVLCRRRRILGDDHKDTVMALNNVIASLRKMNRYQESRPLCEELVMRLRAMFGEDEPCVERAEVWLQEACNASHSDDLISD